MEAMTAGGYSTSATQDGAWITSRDHAWRVGRRDRRIAEGDLVAFAAGASAGDLLTAYEAAGEALPPIPVAHGLGLGFDPPVISPDLPQTSADERLDPGTVLAVTAYVWEPGVGAVFHRDAVLIGEDGPEVLTSSPGWAQTTAGIG
jgi:Xaa-Pro aminopeptidase